MLSENKSPLVVAESEKCLAAGQFRPKVHQGSTLPGSPSSDLINAVKHGASR
jgi:hypothetical protein